jgi:hypothetical protein
MTFADDAARICRPPDIVARLNSFAHNLLRAEGHGDIRNTRWRAGLGINQIFQMQRCIEN